jgi:hypothetical protein
MVLVGAVQIALGWVWHTVYRARHHWTLRREGALSAAAAVAAFGLLQVAMGMGQSKIDERIPAEAAAPPALTAEATPPAAEATRPLEIMPAAAPIETVAAAPSPAPELREDLIAQKIMERLGDDIPTASLDAGKKPAAKERAGARTQHKLREIKN